MGAGGSVDTEHFFSSSTAPAVHPRYFCHNCQRIFQVPASHNPVLQCVVCDSGAIEECVAAAPSPVESGLRGLFGHGHGGSSASAGGRVPLTADQARRITHATAMLRLIEQQLRDELEQLQSAFEAAAARQQQSAQSEKPHRLTAAMRVKLRHKEVSVDALCGQPACPICSEDFVVGERECALPCGHLFHRACVVPWLEMKGNCPICRAELKDTVPAVAELCALSMDELDDKLREIGVEIPDVSQREKIDVANLLFKKLNEQKTREEEELRAAQAQQQSSSAEMDLLRVLPLLTMFNEFGDGQVRVQVRNVSDSSNNDDDDDENENEEDENESDAQGEEIAISERERENGEEKENESDRVPSSNMDDVD